MGGPRELPLVVHGLRQTVVTRWRGGSRQRAGVRIVNGDPLVALEAEIRRRLGDGDGRSVLGPGRSYLVTGCAGFIGSQLVEALVARGCSVLGVDAFIDNYPRSVKERNLDQCLRHGRVRFVGIAHRSCNDAAT